MTFRILDSARKEFRQARVRYSKVRPELGMRFRSAVVVAFDQIESQPLRYAKYSGHARMYRAKRFPYGVNYVFHKSDIVVIAIMHLHRRPGYWKGRLKGLEP